MLLLTGQVDVRFLDWLAGIVSQASKTAAEHHALSATADKLTTEIQTQFNLSSIIVRVQYITGCMLRSDATACKLRLSAHLCTECI